MAEQKGKEHLQTFRRLSEERDMAVESTIYFNGMINKFNIWIYFIHKTPSCF